VSANIAISQGLVDTNRDMLKYEFAGLVKRQDTASKQHMETLKLLQQIGKGLHELILEQSQVIQGAPEGHKREQVQLTGVEISLDQALTTVPSRPCLELFPSVVTALKARRQHTDNNEMEAVVAVW